MESVEIIPPRSGWSATVELPGSKSHANRAVLCAALAEGSSCIDRFLIADDTLAMVNCLESLGLDIQVDVNTRRVSVVGIGGPVQTASQRSVSAQKSGTTARFIVPVLAFGQGEYHVDGQDQLRERPFTDLVVALRSVGANISSELLPMQILGIRPTQTAIAVRGDISSQFLSGLMMAAPITDQGLEIRIEGALVSKPYVELTAAVMSEFGAEVDIDIAASKVSVSGGGYHAADITLEPDASAASYFFGAAAISESEVTIPGLGISTLQGDMAFVRALEQMGALVEVGPNSTTVKGVGKLRGIEIDMADFSDTAQTLAVVATHACSPTKITGIGFIKNKETDRVSAVVNELQRAGIKATLDDDGMTIYPGKAKPVEIETYDDHRMAMSFSLLGLRNEGIKILDPQCVSKTFPKFFDEFTALTEGSR